MHDVMTKVAAQLGRHGLDIEDAFHIVESRMTPASSPGVRVGAFIAYISQAHRVRLLVAEFRLLARLLSASTVPGSGNPEELITLAHVRQVSLLSPGDTASDHTQDSAAALRLVRDSMLKTGRVNCAWGVLPPTWRRLVLDTSIRLLLEESVAIGSTRRTKQIQHQQLKAATAERIKPPTGGEEVLRCREHMAEVCARPAVPPDLPVEAFAARLLYEGISLPVATLQVAARAAAEISIENRVGQVRLTNGLGEIFVEFPQPLPARPVFVHLSQSPRPWSLSVHELSKCGARLQVREQAAQCKTGLWLAYRAASPGGQSSGCCLLSRCRSNTEEQTVQLYFHPPLPHMPTILQVETGFVESETGKCASQRQGLRYNVSRLCPRGFQIVATTDRSPRILTYEGVMLALMVSTSRLQQIAPLVPTDNDISEDGKLLQSLQPLSTSTGVSLVGLPLGQSRDFEDGQETESSVAAAPPPPE